jgi:hypothetical protein
MNRRSSCCRAIAVAFLLTAGSFLTPTGLAIAQTCGAAGCTSGPTNYNTNQGGNSYYCLDKDCEVNGTGGTCSPITNPYLTIPANTNTNVAADDANSYSSNPWNYGVTGQVLIANTDARNSAAVTMTIYYGPFCPPANDCFYSIANTVTLGPGEADWIPFTNLNGLELSPDFEPGFAFFVYLQSNTVLRCYAESYYTWEHD